MAVIQKLRNSGLVVIVIIVALVIFAANDIFNNRMGGSDRSGNPEVAGTAFGKDIKIDEAMELLNKYLKMDQENNPNLEINEEYLNSKLNGGMNGQGIWDELVDKYGTDVLVKKAGIRLYDIDISEELMGEHANPAIANIEGFKVDGKFDRKTVESIYKQSKSNREYGKFINSLIEYIKKEVPRSRYFTYVAKGIYRPKTMDQYRFMATTQGNSGKMVSLPLTDIQDKDVKVTDKDIQDYIDKYPGQFKQEQSRDIQFVSKKVIPSAKDTADAIKAAQGFATEFAKKDKNDTTGGNYVPKIKIHDPQFVKDSNLQKVFARLKGAEIGQVIGPVFDNKDRFWVLKKTGEKKDTAHGFVKVRHILISTQNLASNKMPVKDSLEAQDIANKLAERIRKGEDLGKLAMENSADPGSASKNGLYDWMDMTNLDPKFKEYCLKSTPGSLGVIKTSFGYHVIRTEDAVDNIDYGVVFENAELQAGTETVNGVQSVMDAIYNAASDGVAIKFEKAVEKAGSRDADIKLRVGPNLTTSNLGIPGVESKDIIRQIYVWLFDSKRKENDIKKFSNDKVNMVVRVDVCREAGLAKAKDVKAKVEPIVRAQLKAKKLKEKFDKALASAKDINALAKALNVQVATFDRVSQNGSGFMLNNEKVILGAITGIATGKMSPVIEGNSYVAVVLVEKRDVVDPTKATNITKTPGTFDDFMSSGSNLARFARQSILKIAEVRDYRYQLDSKRWPM